MTDKARTSTLSSLQRLRTDARVDAEASVRAARQELERAEQAWADARQRLAKLTDAERRDAVKVRAGALQRAEACRVALSGARAEASAKVTAELARVLAARVKRDAVEDAWRGARADERVVERVLERREAEAEGARQRSEDDDNDERGQRR